LKYRLKRKELEISFLILGRKLTTRINVKESSKDAKNKSKVNSEIQSFNKMVDFFILFSLGRRKQSCRF